VQGDLADLGEPVTDRTLVLNVLCGLNEKFASIGCHLRRGRPFPSFLEVCDDLILEEITMAEKASTPSSALLAGTSSTPSAPPPQRQSSRGSGRGKGTGGAGGSGGPSSSGKGGRGKRGKATKGGGPPQPATGGGGSSSHNSTAPTQAANAQWPSFYNPWTGAIQMWPMQRPLVAPPPQPAAAPAQHQAQQHALVAHQQAAKAQQQALQAQVQPAQLPYYGFMMPPPVYGTVPAPVPQAPPGFSNPMNGASWDQQSLASTFSTMSLQQASTD